MDVQPAGFPDPALLIRIEDHFWTPDGSVPRSARAAVRGAPISGEKFLAHATRQARESGSTALEAATWRR